MRNLFFSLLLLTSILSLAGCGTKECECQVFDKCYYPNDSIDARSDTVYTLYNYTRSNCTQFNEDDTINMDSTSYIHHKVICKEN